jgi:hypothetical protein
VTLRLKGKAEMADELKPMQLMVDLDWATMHCPCGSSARTDTGSEYQSWQEKHIPHSNGKYWDICSDDGARIMSERPEPVLRKF